jgi:hypothetical protein
LKLRRFPHSIAAPRSFSFYLAHPVRFIPEISLLSIPD